MAKIAPYVFFQEFDDNGVPLSGGLVYTYEAGTTTPKATYTDSSESTANANPIVLDASGRANVWLETGAYKFVLRTSAGVLVKEVDNIVGEASNVFGASVTDISTNTAVTDAYKNGVINCTAALTLSLLDVATAEEGFLFTVKNSSVGNITIDPDASELIDGAITKVLMPGESILIVCNGASWNSLFLQPIINEFADNVFRIQDNGDATKEIAFEASGITTATTRTLTVPDASGTLLLVGDVPTTAQSLALSKSVNGCVLSNDGTDADHDITITAGTKPDSTVAELMTLSSAVTKQIDASWVTGTNQGGLSSSLTVANNTWYHVFLIKVAGVVDVGFDTSVSAANLVADHGATAYKRIGSVLTDGSANITPFIQTGNDFVWDVIKQDSTTLPTATAALISLTVPTGIKVKAKVSSYVGRGGVTTARYILYTNPAQTDTTPSATIYNQVARATASGEGVSTIANLDIITNTSGQIRQRSSGTVDGASVAEINTFGWADLEI